VNAEENYSGSSYKADPYSETSYNQEPYKAESLHHEPAKDGHIYDETEAYDFNCDEYDSPENVLNPAYNPGFKPYMPYDGNIAPLKIEEVPEMINYGELNKESMPGSSSMEYGSYKSGYEQKAYSPTG
jgi:hypothetical protein